MTNLNPYITKRIGKNRVFTLNVWLFPSVNKYTNNQNDRAANAKQANANHKAIVFFQNDTGWGVATTGCE